jgi:hypothetical protein
MFLPFPSFLRMFYCSEEFLLSFYFTPIGTFL